MRGELKRSAMALNLYRRHGSNCPGGRRLHDMTYEADELRRTWKQCSCPIYASGTLSGHFKRKNTERKSWSEAKVVVDAWKTAGKWDGDTRPTPTQPHSAVNERTTQEGVTI